MSILDRYLIRQVLTPYALALLVFTFCLIIPGLKDYAEQFIAKGAPAPIIISAILTLLPGALALSIPMSLLLGLLVGFGKLSGDREFVAMQACGVSLGRLLRPVTLIAVLSAGGSAYMWMVGMPAGNQRFREIAFEVVASLAEGEVRPKIFFEQFPGLTLFVRDVPRTGGWDGVFLADARAIDHTDVYLARYGRVIIDRVRKTVDVVLQDLVRHASDNQDPSTYDVLVSKQAVITIDPRAVFPPEGPVKGIRESSIRELQARAAQRRKDGESDHEEQFEIQAKYAIPFGCLIFGIVGLALGATNRRDGTLAGFVVGLIVIFLYYALLEFGRGLARSSYVAPWLGAWLADLILGSLGVLLFLLRRRVADQPLIPAFIMRLLPKRRQRTMRLWRLPITILDRYVTGTYFRILVLSLLSLATIFYVSTFVELAERAFRGDITWGLLASYIWNLTPQYVYYIIPLSVLIATLTAIALMTKSSELIVMRACGISMYRTILPLMLVSLIAAGTLFAIEQTVLGPSNRRAAIVREAMRGRDISQFDVLTRRWVAGTDGDIYNYNYYDQNRRAFTRLSIFEFSAAMNRITARTFAANATALSSSEFDAGWRLENGWTRRFQDGKDTEYVPFDTTTKTLEPVAHFSTEAPNPAFMSYTQLRGYVDQLDAGGGNVVSQRAALAQKVSFPFVTLVMALIAVPFAVTIGRSGAMAGIGVAIAVAIAYWVISSIFTALGAGGALPPQLAAWAPNVIFASVAVYMLLSVRT